MNDTRSREEKLFLISYRLSCSQLLQGNIVGAGKMPGDVQMLKQLILDFIGVLLFALFRVQSSQRAALM